MIGNMGIAILFCNEYVVERRPFRSAAAAFHGACGEPLRLRLQGLTLPAIPIGVGRPSLHFTLWI
ncbi:hypothetical protein ACUMHR_00485 [Rossellomorea marisflavi]